LLSVCTVDVAKWVLNKQIKQTGRDAIEYNYDLIDDFDRTECEFIGPLGYLYHQFGGKPTTELSSSPYQRMERISPVPGKRQMPSKFEPGNHMLHLMVRL